MNGRHFSGIAAMALHGFHRDIGIPASAGQSCSVV
jgi:hypothetical protein